MSRHNTSAALGIEHRDRKRMVHVLAEVIPIQPNTTT